MDTRPYLQRFDSYDATNATGRERIQKAADLRRSRIEYLEGVIEICQGELQIVTAQVQAAERRCDHDRLELLIIDEDYQRRRMEAAERQLKSLRLADERETVAAVAAE